MANASYRNFFFPHWQSVKHLSDLFSSLEILEPQNPELFHKMSLAFTRVVRHFPSEFVGLCFSHEGLHLTLLCFLVFLVWPK